MKGELSYRRPETMTVRDLKEEIRVITRKINKAISDTPYRSTALNKEIKFLQTLRSGKEQKYDNLKFWFKGKKKAELIEEYKELVRFSRFDRFTKEAQEKEERRSKKAYDKFIHNRANLPGGKISYDEFMDLRNFFGNVSKELIENFGYNEIMDIYDEVSDTDKNGRIDLVMEMHRINSEFKDESPADKLIILKERLGIDI